MDTGHIAKRYARALLKSLNNDISVFTKYGANLQVLSESFGVKKLKAVLSNPSISPKIKDEIVGDLAQKVGADGVLKKFLSVVVLAGRVDQIPSISKSISAMIDEQSGKSKAILSTATELNEAQIADIRSHLQKILDRQLDLEVVVDPTILGGFKVEMGHKIIDLSLAKKINSFIKSVA